MSSSVILYSVVFWQKVISDGRVFSVATSVVVVIVVSLNRPGRLVGGFSFRLVDGGVVVGVVGLVVAVDADDEGDWLWVMLTNSANVVDFQSVFASSVL